MAQSSTKEKRPTLTEAGRQQPDVQQKTAASSISQVGCKVNAQDSQPGGSNGQHSTIDAAELLEQAIVERQPKEPGQEKKDEDPHRPRYEIRGGCISEIKVKQSEEDYIETANLVAGFDARITAQSWDVETQERWYRIAVTPPGRAVREFEISARDFEDTRRLKPALGNAAGVGNAIMSRYTSRIGEAIHLLSGPNIPEYQRCAHVGWVGDDFIVPGWEREDVTIATESKLVYRFDEDADLATATAMLAQLLEAIPANTITPILAYLFGAPLADIVGRNDERHGMMIVGETGTLKTTIAKIMMTLYGADFAHDENLIRMNSEGTTTTAVVTHASHVSGLPLLLDNYKARLDNGLTGVIHAMLEGSGKDRAKVDGSLRKSMRTKAWPIITGENLPDDNDAATFARLLIVNIDWPSIDKETGEHPLDLDSIEMMDRTMAPHFNALGAAWLRWLQSDAGKSEAEAVFSDYQANRLEMARRISESNINTPNAARIASNLTYNAKAWQLLERWSVTADILAPHAQAFEVASANMMKAITASATGAVEALVLLSAIREMLDAGLYHLTERDEMGAAETDDRRLGWQDAEGIYLVPGPTKNLVIRNYGPAHLNGASTTKMASQLHSRGLLLGTTKGRSTTTKRIKGKKRRVWHLSPDTVI